MKEQYEFTLERVEELLPLVGEDTDYIAGRSEPTLKIARLLCRVLNISPAAMLGF